MIRNIPGWLNYVILFGLYLLALNLIELVLFGRFTAVPWVYQTLAAAIHAGMYLSKWSYVENRWRFW